MKKFHSSMSMHHFFMNTHPGEKILRNFESMQEDAFTVLCKLLDIYSTEMEHHTKKII